MSNCGSVGRDLADRTFIKEWQHCILPFGFRDCVSSFDQNFRDTKMRQVERFDILTLQPVQQFEYQFLVERFNPAHTRNEKVVLIGR